MELRSKQTAGKATEDASALFERAGVVLERPVDRAADERIARERAHAAAPRDRSSLGTGLLVALAAVLAFFALWVGSGAYGRVAHLQGAETLRASILSAADQCYAIEGAYPRTLDDLEERYALAVNHEGYDVLYDAFASNIAPTVVVRPR